MSIFEQLNELGRKREQFFFAIDFLSQNILLLPKNEQNENIAFSIGKIKSSYQPSKNKYPAINATTPILFEDYKYKLKLLKEQISLGNTYLANLTAPTKIELNGTLQDCYAYGDAKFKLFVKDAFVCFSPERFISIKDNQIFTMPMKGTAAIDNLPQLLSSEKELAEHAMSVDLLRNDMSLIGTNVRLKYFRRASLVKNGQIWQTSSKICANLTDNWQDNLGDIFQKILPAGSVTGTPKRKTVEILRQIEDYDRGFFTGIFGYFGGDFLDSAVAIRFIEQTKDGYVYKSGGGITEASSAKEEYEELLAKIYLPNTPLCATTQP